MQVGRLVPAHDVVEAVGDLTGGAGADVVLELTPMAHAPVEQALLAAKHGGTVVLAGLKGNAQVPLRTDLIINRALTVRGAFGVDAQGYAVQDVVLLYERQVDGRQIRR